MLVNGFIVGPLVFAVIWGSFVIARAIDRLRVDVKDAVKELAGTMQDHEDRLNF